MATWWERPGLDVRDGRFHVAGRDAEAIACEHGTPVFAYDIVRIREQAEALGAAFERPGLDLRFRLALKAQRTWCPSSTDGAGTLRARRSASA